MVQLDQTSSNLRSTVMANKDLNENNLSPQHKTVLTELDIDVARALLLAFKPLAKEAPTMTMPIFVSLLEVIAHEGEPVTKYSEVTELYKTVMTRHLLDLSKRGRHGNDDGLDYVYQERDRKDTRINRTFVTRKGAEVLRSIWRALEIVKKR